MYTLFFVIIAAVSSFDKALAAAEEEPTWIPVEQVILQGLDKVTGRVFEITIHKNQELRFGTFEIYVRDAYKTPPEEIPETVAFVEIYDNRPEEPRARIYSGWMFASSYNYSPEHPVYDIWVKDAILPKQPDSEIAQDEDGDLMEDNTPLKQEEKVNA